MMSIMNERIERKGEILLSTPVKAGSIILGKMLPYFLGMLAICTGLTFWIKAPLIIILPLIPVIFFFLANALLIGMLSRSFKELSFVSIFFSTVATSYLFFPSIFANVHVISLISPLTLIVLELQGTAWTATDYLYSTSLFWLTSAVLFYVAARNFKEERLFSEKNLVTRMREFLSEVFSQKRPFLSLFLLTGFSIPFVFMVQLMCLVLFFNLPMPYSLVLLLLFAALIEEIAKGIGIYTIFARDPAFFTWRNLLLACAATATRVPRGRETAALCHPRPDHGIGLWQHPLPLARRALDAAPAPFRGRAHRSLLPENGGQGLVCTGTSASPWSCTVSITSTSSWGGSHEIAASLDYCKEGVPRAVQRADDPACRPAPALHRALLLVPHGRAHIDVRPVLALEIFPLPVQCRLCRQRFAGARLPRQQARTSACTR